MSKPATNPFFEADFSKLMDVSKVMGGFKMPNFDFDALMVAQRKNMETMAAVNQAAFESWQALARRQADLMRQGFEECTNLANAIMACPSPEEKVIKQAEASKAAVEKCIANAREIAETVTKCNNQALDTVTTRMSEGLEELRGLIKNGRAAA